MGLYQLLYLRIPAHAILNETVKTTKTLKKTWATGFVNAILRNFIRQQKELLSQTKDNLICQHSHPLWFINLLQKAWPDNWGGILIANNNHPPMHLRVNIQKISRDKYLAELSKTIQANTTASNNHSITLQKPCKTNKLPFFQQGFVSIQDLAAQFIAPLLDLEPNLRVLDACAAPGGKTCHILELAPNLQELVTIDISQKRLKLIQENLTRLQLSATLICGDASKPKDWWDGKKFDRILVDAPCSGTGVIRRHPDVMSQTI